MDKNGDYDLRRASIQKLKNFLNDFKLKQQELEKNKALIEQNLQTLKAGKDKNLKSLSVD